MSLRILVDADIQSDDLADQLRIEGHDVLTANEAGLRTANDPEILALAISDSRALMTRNAGDFRELHIATPLHSGILVVYQDDDQHRHKNMSVEDIVRAVGKR